MSSIYVAGKWEERNHIKCLMVRLEKLGHTITEDWTKHSEKDKNWKEVSSVADIKGIQQCDVFVGRFLNSYTYKGALAELGAALALNRQCLIIGHEADSCIFTHHPLIRRFEDDEELLEWIGDNL